MSNQKEERREFDWLDNAENIRPLRGGRPAAAVLALATGPTFTVEEAKQKFENDFRNADDSDDPLEVMMKFVNWFQWNIPSGRVDVLQPMVYRILTKYGTMPQYRNDERILKLWLILADNFPERGFAVMELACNRGSCKELAKFYVFWSKMYEYAEQMNKARDILVCGLNNGAIPISEIHEASDALELRICRQTMEKENCDLDFGDDGLIEHKEEDRYAFYELEPVRHCTGIVGPPIIRIDAKKPPKNVSAPVPKSSFQIFADFEEPIVSLAPPDVKQEFDNLNCDPDYQSIFGYKGCPDLHVSLSDNTSTKNGQFKGLLGLPNSEEPLAGFVAYCETQKLKLKFFIRRELVETKSVEEAFLERMRNLNFAGGDAQILKTC